MEIAVLALGAMVLYLFLTRKEWVQVLRQRRAKRNLNRFYTTGKFKR